MRNINAGIIGAGRIGSELYRKIQSLGWNIKFILEIDGVYKNLKDKIDKHKNYLNYCKDLDIGFLAISKPKSDDGSIAFGFMKSLLEKNIPVVTSEKGAYSNYFRELKKWREKTGYSATVGGGTRMLRYLEKKINPEVTEIHAVVNGTLNYMFYWISKGKNLEEVAKKARELGYAEPGAKSAFDIIKTESEKDVPMKSSILFNISGISSEILRAKDIVVNKMNESDLEKLIKESKNRRYIVSITKEEKEEDVIDGFNHKIGKWFISGGFKNIEENPLYGKLIIKNVNNSIIICENEKIYQKKPGPGAGAEPTASSMIKDAIQLLQRWKRK